jgi:hypothetical protein
MAILLNVAAFLVSTAAAQHAEQAPAKSTPSPQPTINLQFPGGTLDEYLKALQTAAGKINLIVEAPEAQAIRVPSVQLESVTVRAALGLLTGLHKLADGTNVQVTLEEFGEIKGDDRVIPVLRLRTQPWGIQLGSPPEVRVWNIGDLLADKKKPEGVLTAVETAVGLLDSDHRPAQIRYHEDTTLLVVSGNSEQLNAIDRVVGGIREGVKRERAAAAATSSSRDAIADLTRWLEDYQRLGAEEQQKRDSQGRLAKLDDLARVIEKVRMAVLQRERDFTIEELSRRLEEKDKK